MAAAGREEGRPLAEGSPVPGSRPADTPPEGNQAAGMRPWEGTLQITKKKKSPQINKKKKMRA